VAVSTYSSSDSLAATTGLTEFNVFIEQSMNLTIRHFTSFLVSVLLTLSSGSYVQAASELDSDLINRSLDSVEFQTFTAGFTDARSLDESILKASRLRSSAVQCITRLEKELESSTRIIGKDLIDQLLNKESLGAEEKLLAAKVTKTNNEIKHCKFLLEKSSDLLIRLNEQQSKLRQKELGERNPWLFLLLKNGITGLPSHIKQAFTKQLDVPGIEIDINSALKGIVAIIIGLLIGQLIRRNARPPTLVEGQSFSSQIVDSSTYLAERWAPLLLSFIACGTYIYIIAGYQFTHSHLNKMLGLSVGFILLQILIRVGMGYLRKLFDSEINRPFPVDDLYIRLVISSTLLCIWMFFVVIPDTGYAKDTPHLLFDSVLSLLLIYSHLDLAVFLKNLPSTPTLAKFVRLAAALSFSFSLILELAGYTNFARLIWGGVVLSAISLTVFYLLETLLRDFFDGIDTGQRKWQQNVRSFMSLENNEPVPGIIWLKVLSIVSLWIVLIFSFLKSWDVPEATISTLASYFTDGFKVGSSLITPSNVLIGIFTFSTLLILFRWSREGLDRKYLSKSRMDIGAREAMTTIIGYVGFVIAAMVGLHIAGVGFGNLAVVAGALSLGIGFGLQNIVNNFVSGIILLFERPIKTGDWIVTGSTEGYVKKIRVRSTEVQTFDRSDVIVPNSELISTQVTNWTLRDKYGRVKIPVGVAYGSDTELVKKLLEDVTKNMPDIVQNRSTLPVKVLFLGFGESSLDFELRCYIFDIGKFLDVKSNLHFAIDKAFRQNSIEIAFPQRDIHIKDESKLPALTSDD